MMMKSAFWWRKPEYPEETTDLRQVTDETFLGSHIAKTQTKDKKGGHFRGCDTNIDRDSYPVRHISLAAAGNGNPQCRSGGFHCGASDGKERLNSAYRQYGVVLYII